MLASVGGVLAECWGLLRSVRECSQSVGLSWVLLGCPALLGSLGFPRLSGLSCAPLGSPGLSGALLSYPGVSLAVLVCPGLS